MMNANRIVPSGGQKK